MFAKILKLVANSLDVESRDTVDTRDTPQVNMFNAKNLNINDGSFAIYNTTGGGQGLQSLDSTDADCF
jgi:hypothetical protein